jgi:antitoxin (DNA-binding transcriptional repressor) of toxin-antitoxin stability system
MSSFIPIEEAQLRLLEIVEKLPPGEEIIITPHEQPIARLVREQTATLAPRQPGLLKDMIVSIADDFDAPLEDFKEYME